MSETKINRMQLTFGSRHLDEHGNSIQIKENVNVWMDENSWVIQGDIDNEIKQYRYIGMPGASLLMSQLGWLSLRLGEIRPTGEYALAISPEVDLVMPIAHLEPTKIIPLYVCDMRFKR